MRSAENNFLESKSSPTIKHGGRSSSEDLRAFQENAVADLNRVWQESGDLKSTVLSNLNYSKLGTDAFAAMIGSLMANLPATGLVSGASTEHFTNRYTVTGDTTADISNTFGQVTLGINSTEQKLVYVDAVGTRWIPEDLAIYYSYASSPNDLDYEYDADARRAVDGKSYSIWAKKRGSSGDVWVIISIPSSTNQSPLVNSICLYPFPPWTSQIKSVQYQQPDGSWTSVDLSYQLKYNADTGYIDNASNMRFILPAAVQMTSIKINLVPGCEDYYWGFKHIRCEYIDFQPASNLVVDFASHGPGTITQTVVHGRDPAALDRLSRSIDGTQVTVALTQQVGGTSPVITGVESFW